jgi:hypothetical protein
MISSVKGIGVFPGAVFTHREDLHGRLFPVIREGFNDCVARPAVRAVDEGVFEPAVFGVHHFSMAVLADRNIRRDEDKAFALPRFLDLEVFQVKGRDLFYSYFFNLTEGRPFFLESFEEGAEAGFFFSFQMDLDPETDVFDPAFEVEFFSQAVDKRPESHTLNYAKDNNPAGESWPGKDFFFSRHVLVFTHDKSRRLNNK